MDECTSPNISGLFSAISLISWIGAQLPQIVENYKNKSAEGISPSFLLLWFMGDFLSFTSCLLNDAALSFQIYLSLFFLSNDVTLCYQYYYYNSVYPRKYPTATISAENTQDLEWETQITTAKTSDSIPIRVHTVAVGESTQLSPNETKFNYSSSSDNSVPKQGDYTVASPGIAKVVATGAALHSGLANAAALHSKTVVSYGLSDYKEAIGLVLAWACTCVYVSSRCPQLYKNYKRKSVDGISPLLFGSALMGNLTYTLSVLTSCAFLSSSDKETFFWKQLPYLLGSSGAIVFDVAYFYQRHIYRDAGIESMVMGLHPWDEENGSVLQ